MLTIEVSAGQTVAVGDVIARVGGAAAGDPEMPDPTAAAAPETASALSPAVAPVVTSDGDRSPQRLATPIAHRLAAQLGVTLNALRGTGPRGRITKPDVLSAAGQAVPAEGPGMPAPSVPEAQPTGVELTPVQQLIMERMADAKATIPHFHVETEVVMNRALALRREIKQTVSDAEHVPSINDLVIRAGALALRAHPRASGSYRHDRFERHERINVGRGRGRHRRCADRSDRVRCGHEERLR